MDYSKFDNLDSDSSNDENENENNKKEPFGGLGFDQIMKQAVELKTASMASVRQEYEASPDFMKATQVFYERLKEKVFILFVFGSNQ